MASKKKLSLKKKVLIGAATGVAALGFWASQAFYTVKEVVDGDTFVTVENQYVRFDKVDAPEIGLCLGKESKDELEKLVLNKKVFIKVRYVEKDWGRLVGSVYGMQGNIEEIMLSKGLVTLRNGSEYSGVVEKAKAEKVGVYSAKCTQTINIEDPKCGIKGNIRARNKYFRFPGCKQYDTTLVQLHFGDKWFCSESEAKKAGFIKGSDCR
jgi:endonuclease YncB( thermonuclease family)